MLSGAEIERSGLLGGAAEPGHLQPHGVDLSLAAVWHLSGVGALGCDEADRALPSREELVAGADAWLHLPPGTYGIRFTEWVQIPLDCGGLLFPRSSLLRMGVHVPTAVWDAGFRGRGESLLMVSHLEGVRLQIGARIGQLVLFRLTGTTLPYRGVYQEGGTELAPIIAAPLAQ